MARKIAVLFVHGIHNDDDKFHLPMQRCLEDALGSRLKEYVDFEPANWAPIVRRHQKAYMERLIQGGLVEDTDYRRLALQGLGDAAAYQKTKDFRNSSYYEIQGEVRRAIDALDQRGGPDRPLVFVGHSLGCHILSTFAWDTYSMRHTTPESLQGKDPKVREFADYLRSGSPFRRLATLAGFVTMGCNMPLFTFTFGPDRIFPITKPRNPMEHPAFPGSGLPPEVKARARWLNFYSRNDLLGYPLKPLNPDYAAEERIADHEVASERWWRRYGLYLAPALSAYAAHTGYWTHRPVIKGTTKLLTDLITAGEPPKPKRFAFGRRRTSPPAEVPA